ncbi:MAG: hypothetical protein AAF602_13100 [Myxococcota bacterium]
MFERIRLVLPVWARPRAGASFRYGLLDRFRRCGRPHGVTLLAFGFEGPRGLRCVVRGGPHSVRALLKGVKVGTALSLRHQGVTGALGISIRKPVPTPEAVDAVVWAHQGPLEGRRGPRQPLATPWSSHRDLLGYREAMFFDAKPLRRTVDPDDVHARCGGASRALASGAAGTWPLGTLLRVAAAVMGVVPADRRCFGLFVHLALGCGWPTREVARAICLTPRRIRQLAANPHPLLPLARCTLADPRLQRVP